MENTSKRELTFKVQYFKVSGKYYSEGEFTINCTTIEHSNGAFTVYMDDAVEHLKRLQASGKSPGLIEWHNGFHTLLDHPEGYPVLLPLR